MGLAVVWILPWVLAELVLPTVRVSRWWLACLVVVWWRECFWCWCWVACVLVFGGSGRATRGWCLAGLWSWCCRLSLVLGYSLRLSLGL